MCSYSSRAPSHHGIAGVGIGLIALFVALVTWTMNTASYREWSAFVIALVIVLVSVPVLSKQVRREGDFRIFWFLFAALLLKLLFAVIRHYVTFEVYGVADAVVYNRVGTEIARGFRAGDFWPGLPSYTDTEFIKLVTGFVYTLIGPTTWGGFLFFAWLSFWGQFLMYRAFTLAVPKGSAKMYRYLLFFLPSLLFWPSSIGKEAWMVFALGISVFGCARVFTGKVLGGTALLALGSAMAGVVRPHVAGFIGVGFAGAILLMKPNKEKLRELAPLARAASVGVASTLLVAMVIYAGSFLQQSGVETSKGLTGTLASVSERTSEADSTFSVSPLTSPIAIPQAVVTVLFRPFVFEAYNSQMLITAVEGAVLMLLVFGRIPALWGAVKSVRRNAFIGFCLVYTAVTIIGLSSMANFGLLARQRTMLFPIFLALLCYMPSRREAPLLTARVDAVR